MEDRLQKHLDLLKHLDYERRRWLLVSVFVVAAVLGVIYDWNQVVESKLAWVMVSGGLTLTVVWWYWTMRVVRHLIEAKQDEYYLLSDIVQSIRVIKVDIKETFKPVDKSK